MDPLASGLSLFVVVIDFEVEELENWRLDLAEWVDCIVLLFVAHIVCSEQAGLSSAGRAEAAVQKDCLNQLASA